MAVRRSKRGGNVVPKTRAPLEGRICELSVSIREILGLRGYVPAFPTRWSGRGHGKVRGRSTLPSCSQSGGMPPQSMADGRESTDNSQRRPRPNPWPLFRPMTDCFTRWPSPPMATPSSPGVTTACASGTPRRCPRRMAPRRRNETVLRTRTPGSDTSGMAGLRIIASWCVPDREGRMLSSWPGNVLPAGRRQKCGPVH